MKAASTRGARLDPSDATTVERDFHPNVAHRSRQAVVHGHHSERSQEQYPGQPGAHKDYDYKNDRKKR